ncbi:hypothetical protein NZD89_20335 [Alicyclobacillus fastidiosus]|uniref:Uncharacterized protein n=1 Tax=Alicyclobacillus fastidiosus TaxID=392011 RepID=A0ABY6ZDK0_9BACL|nr:hypothetical protein [Alicyclobacillus fastidiosus]WAH40638.1 hypothetical protein NZD89_20335 [Alicyclobacillus fastidiosus]
MDKWRDNTVVKRERTRRALTVEQQQQIEDSEDRVGVTFCFTGIRSCALRYASISIGIQRSCSVLPY